MPQTPSASGALWLCLLQQPQMTAWHFEPALSLLVLCWESCALDRDSQISVPNLHLSAACIAQGALCHNMQQGQGHSCGCQVHSSGPLTVETPKETAGGRAAWEVRSVSLSKDTAPTWSNTVGKKATARIWGFLAKASHVFIKLYVFVH